MHFFFPFSSSLFIIPEQHVWTGVIIQAGNLMLAKDIFTHSEHTKILFPFSVFATFTAKHEIYTVNYNSHYGKNKEKIFIQCVYIYILLCTSLFCICCQALDIWLVLMPNRKEYTGLHFQYYFQTYASAAFLHSMN